MHATRYLSLVATKPFVWNCTRKSNLIYIIGYYFHKKAVMNTDQCFTKDDNYQDVKPYDEKVPWDSLHRREGRVRRFHVLRTSTEVITICLGRLRKVISFTMHFPQERKSRQENLDSERFTECRKEACWSEHQISRHKRQVQMYVDDPPQHSTIELTSAGQ